MVLDVCCEWPFVLVLKIAFVGWFVCFSNLFSFECLCCCGFGICFLPVSNIE